VLPTFETDSNSLAQFNLFLAFTPPWDCQKTVLNLISQVMIIVLVTAGSEMRKKVGVIEGRRSWDGWRQLAAVCFWDISHCMTYPQELAV